MSDKTTPNAQAADFKGEHFSRSVGLPATAAAALEWHARTGALARLSPPWERVEVVSQSGGIRDGARVSLRTKAGPIWLGWEAEHYGYVEGRQFCDRALSGPFARWEHRHGFADVSKEAGGGCELTDDIHYALPGGAAGRLVAGGFVRRKLERMFAYRQAVTRADLEFSRDHERAPKLRVLISGASGLVGSALTAFLTTQGHQVIKLVRRPARGADEIFWDPAAERVNLDAAVGRIDAVVHLAGAGIADARWTEARKHEIRESRVRGTSGLARALAAMARPPRVVVGGSAIGYYGDGGDAWQVEGAAAGSGFLAEVTSAWEAAWAPLDAVGVRRVALRTGVVLSPAGGALAKMLPAFRFGLGGPVGGGRQWWSWISLDDLTGVIGHALLDDSVRGPLNAVAPEPVTSAEFAHTLGRVLGRPAVLPVPAWALRVALGRGLADEALLASQRVRPETLIKCGYRFRHENLETALRHVLGHAS